MSFPYANKRTPASALAAEYEDNIKGKIILITGPSPNSLGAQFVKVVAKHNPKLVILAGRNSTKIQATIDDVKAEAPSANLRALPLDLSSLASIREAVKTVEGWSDVPVVDVLINNAGLIPGSYETTAEGFEMQFGTNHLGHFLLTNLLVPKLLKSSDPRVVSVTSDAHNFSPVRWYDVNFDNGSVYNRWPAYGQSKTANILFILGLAERLGKKGLTAISVHPGVIATSMAAQGMKDMIGAQAYLRQIGLKMPIDALDLVSHDVGTGNHILAAFGDVKSANGQFFTELRPASMERGEWNVWARDKIEADRLWKLSEEMLGEKFEY